MHAKRLFLKVIVMGDLISKVASENTLLGYVMETQFSDRKNNRKRIVNFSLVIGDKLFEGRDYCKISWVSTGYGVRGN